MLKNLVWYLRLDLQQWHIRIRPSEIEPNMMTVKELTLYDMKKFGLEPGLNLEEADVEPFLCVKCNSWISGFCYKHPLIFVKEYIPADRKYLDGNTFPSFFYVADSTIPNAGKGVFTRIPLPSGIAFGPYSGIVSTSKDAETSGYSWQMKQLDGSDCWIDAKSAYFSNWMRYANCARFEKEQNFIALLYNRNIYYYTYKPIVADEELFVWYGKDYGIFLGIANAETDSGPLAPVKRVDCNVEPRTDEKDQAQTEKDLNAENQSTNENVF